jgi:hypothetical protein
LVDLNNWQWALVENWKTKIFSSIYNSSDNTLITELPTIYNITSHWYITCAEVYWELEWWWEFYIHSIAPYQLNDILKDILNESWNKANSIIINSDFSYNENKNLKKEYEEVSKKLGFKNIETNNSSISQAKII